MHKHNQKSLGLLLEQRLRHANALVRQAAAAARAQVLTHAQLFKPFTTTSKGLVLMSVGRGSGA